MDNRSLKKPFIIRYVTNASVYYTSYVCQTPCYKMLNVYLNLNNYDECLCIQKQSAEKTFHTSVMNLVK